MLAFRYPSSFIPRLSVRWYVAIMTATGDKDDAARGEPKSGADAKNGIQKSEDYSKEREEAVASSSVTNSQESKMLKARIFIGNLPADLRTERGELFDKFRKHGRILGQLLCSCFVLSLAPSYAIYFRHVSALSFKASSYPVLRLYVLFKSTDFGGLA